MRPIYVFTSAEMRTEIERRRRSEAKLGETVASLERAAAEIRRLSGLLPICAGCKRIRDATGRWEQLEQYITTHSEADFTHSICPECAGTLYPPRNARPT